MGYESSQVKMTSFLLFLALAAVIFTPVISFMDRNGVVVPRDPFLFVGDTLTLFCNITNPDHRGDSSELYFIRATRDNRSDLIPPRFVKRLTTKAIRLDYPGIGIKDEGNYICLQRMGYSRSRHDEIIGHQRVNVDFSPKKVEDIDCRVYNWEKMTCNWTLGVSYHHPENINVTLTWAKRLHPLSPSYGTQYTCPQFGASKTTCTWPPVVYEHPSVYTMVIRVDTVVGGRVLKHQKSPTFKVETRLYVEPAPVVSFQASEENSTCIGLSWNHSTPAKREKNFTVEYRQLDLYRWRPKHLDIAQMKLMKLLVCELTPFTSYTFRVSVEPYPEYRNKATYLGTRSKWMYVSATTREDVPAIPPSMCASCFVIETCRDANSTQGCRYVTIYFKDIPFVQRHGEITEYSTTLVEQGGIRSVHKKHKTHHSAHQISDARYLVQLKASTAQGFSRQSSNLTIPSTSEIPPVPKSLLVETEYRRKGPFKYNLSWASLTFYNSTNFSRIAILWCEDSVTFQDCKGDIRWIYLPHSAVNYELLVPQKLSVIGIAAEVMNEGTTLSSGIEWSSCIYDKNIIPKHPPRNVRWQKSQPSRGLTISWENSDCSYEKVNVLEYRVSLCRTLDGRMCHEPKWTKIEKRGDLTFNDLIPLKKYLVTVEARSSAGYGPPSKPIVKEVRELAREESGSSNIPLAAITAAIVFGLFLLGVYLIIRTWRQRKERMKEKNKSDYQIGTDTETTIPGYDRSHSSMSSSENSEIAGQETPLITGSNSSKSRSKSCPSKHSGSEWKDSMLKFKRDAKSFDSNTEALLPPSYPAPPPPNGLGYPVPVPISQDNKYCTPHFPKGNTVISRNTSFTDSRNDLDNKRDSCKSNQLPNPNKVSVLIPRSPQRMSASSLDPSPTETSTRTISSEQPVYFQSKPLQSYTDSKDNNSSPFSHTSDGLIQEGSVASESSNYYIAHRNGPESPGIGDTSYIECVQATSDNEQSGSKVQKKHPDSHLSSKIVADLSKILKNSEEEDYASDSSSTNTNNTDSSLDSNDGVETGYNLFNQNNSAIKKQPFQLSELIDSNDLNNVVNPSDNAPHLLPAVSLPDKNKPITPQVTKDSHLETANNDSSASSSDQTCLSGSISGYIYCVQTGEPDTQTNSHIPQNIPRRNEDSNYTDHCI